jgi:hypothetical protein
MLGILSVFGFSLAYSRFSIRYGWLPSTFAGLVVYIASTFLLDTTNLSEIATFAIVLIGQGVCLVLMPKVASDELGAVSSKWEIPTRMISATVLVFVITGVAQLLGPQLTGLLTPFPIYASILAIFTHRSQNGAQAVRLLRGVIAGSFTFIIFFLVTSTTIIAWGIGYSFASAIAISLLTHAVSFRLLKHSTREFQLSLLL